MTTTPRISYKGGYKYILNENYTHQTELLVEIVDTPVFRLNAGTGSADGILWIAKGYAWDGPSGITIDSANFMRGSLVHDALYQLIRDGHMGYNQREYADQVLRETCREDGMGRFRAWYVHRFVRAFGKAATRPSARRPVKEAP